MFFEPKITNIEHDFQIFVVPLQQENWFLMVKVYGWIIFWGKVRCEASLLFLKEIKGTHFKPYFPKSMTERIRYYIWFAQIEHHFKAFFREKSGKTIRYTYPLTKLGWDLGAEINPIMYTKKEWEASRITPFYHNVLEDAIALWV
jgi:hypothetical protein